RVRRRRGTYARRHYARNGFPNFRELRVCLRLLRLRRDENRRQYSSEKDEIQRVAYECHDLRLSAPRFSPTTNHSAAISDALPFRVSIIVGQPFAAGSGAAPLMRREF